MKICLAVYNKRITTIFENTCFFRLFNYDQSSDKLIEAGEILLSKNCSYFSRIFALITARIDVLICGGICSNCKVMLYNYGIQVLDWVYGSSEQVVQAWKEQKLDDYIMPGCAVLKNATRKIRY